MRQLRHWLEATLRSLGRRPKPSVERGGPGFRGIIEATLADIPDIVRYEMQIFHLHEKRYPDDVPFPMNEGSYSEHYKRLILSWGGGAAMYVADARAIGYISWSTAYAGATKQMVIMSIVVEPDYRGNGIGGALLDYARKSAVSSGVNSIRAHVWAHNTPSRSFFERRGFTPVHTVYTLPIME